MPSAFLISRRECDRVPMIIQLFTNFSFELKITMGGERVNDGELLHREHANCMFGLNLLPHDLLPADSHS